MIKKCRLKTSCYGLNTLHLDPDLEIAPIWIRIRVHKHGKFWEKNPVKTELIKNDLFVEKTLNKLTTRKFGIFCEFLSLLQSFFTFLIMWIRIRIRNVDPDEWYPTFMWSGRMVLRMLAQPWPVSPRPCKNIIEAETQKQGSSIFYTVNLNRRKNYFYKHFA